MTDRRGERFGDPHAGVSGRRLFVGVPLPEEAASVIREVVDEVRTMPLPDGARDVRWVRLDGLHLTLRFLGPTPDALVAPTTAAVETVASSASGAIPIELAGSGTFPSGRRPRTLWIGMSQGVDELTELASSTESVLVAAGWQPDGRPFRPHLTLARSDGVAAGRMVADRLAGVMADRRIACTIDRLGLFESLTGGGPARYLPVTLRHLGPAARPGEPVYHQTAPDPS